MAYKAREQDICRLGTWARPGHLFDFGSLQKNSCPIRCTRNLHPKPKSPMWASCNRGERPVSPTTALAYGQFS